MIEPLFDYYGNKDATDVIVAMGSVTQTVKEVVDHLTEQGRKVGCLTVHLYRPFAPEYMFKVLDELELDTNFVFVKIAGENVGKPMNYGDVNSLMKRITKKTNIKVNNWCIYFTSKRSSNKKNKIWP